MEYRDSERPDYFKIVTGGLGILIQQIWMAHDHVGVGSRIFAFGFTLLIFVMMYQLFKRYGL